MILVRLAFQTVLLALAQIWANKVRALLTTLGIVIAVAAVIITVAATNGLRGFVLDQLATLGASKLWIFPDRPDGQRERWSFNQIRLKTWEVDGIPANAPSVQRITPILQMSADVSAGERTKQFVRVQGIRPSWHEIEARPVILGRPFNSIDDDELRPVCIVNDRAIEELNLDVDPTGDFILVNGRRMMIVGVVETKEVLPAFGGEEASTEVYIPYRLAESQRPNPRIYAIAQTFRPEQFEDARAEVTLYLRRTRNLEPGDPNTFGVQSVEQIRTQFNQIAAGITAFAAGIAAISLLVGGIGIMNIMLVSVSERTREIGLRKAVGAKPAVILLQFLVEAVVLCLMGAAIGLGIAFAVVAGLRFIPDFPMKNATIPGWSIMLAAGFASLTGVVFGMFPAIKAARLDPIEALRHE
jgi:putative ABC transport system permease protein